MQSYPLFSAYIPILYKSDRFSSYSSVNRESSYRGFVHHGMIMVKVVEKYGDYNGWSDDLIDDVFGGEPEATWNVD